MDVMAAPVGNRFWELRSKHGRDTLFASPELLWDAACEYFQWCDENPLMEATIEKVRVNGEGDKIVKESLPRMRPYTMHGLCLYLDCNTAYFRQFKATEAGKTEGFSTVITRIEEIVYDQKFSGAAAGFLNANLISRDLGLVDKKENKVSVEQPLFGDEDDGGDNSQEGA